MKKKNHRKMESKTTVTLYNEVKDEGRNQRVTPPPAKEGELEYGIENLKKLSKKQLIKQVILCHHRIGVQEIELDNRRSKLSEVQYGIRELVTKFRSRSVYADHDAKVTSMSEYANALRTKSIVMRLAADHIVSQFPSYFSDTPKSSTDPLWTDTKPRST